MIDLRICVVALVSALSVSACALPPEEEQEQAPEVEEVDSVDQEINVCGGWCGDYYGYFTCLDVFETRSSIDGATKCERFRSCVQNTYRSKKWKSSYEDYTQYNQYNCWVY
jgi:hypothetical protein